MKISFEIPDRDERGVSPVIGVILMVAITVILAAVIASFVLGFGDQVSQSVQAGADISENDDGTATVTWIQEGNAEHLNVTANGHLIPGTDADESLSSVGDTVEIDGSELDDNDGIVSVDVVVTAAGEGGTHTVITQESVEINTTGS